MDFQFNFRCHDSIGISGIENDPTIESGWLMLVSQILVNSIHCVCNNMKMLSVERSCKNGYKIGVRYY